MFTLLRSFWLVYFEPLICHAVLMYNHMDRRHLLAERRMCERQLAALEQAYRAERHHLDQLDAALSENERSTSSALTKSVAPAVRVRQFD